MQPRLILRPFSSRLLVSRRLAQAVWQSKQASNRWTSWVYGLHKEKKHRQQLYVLFVQAGRIFFWWAPGELGLLSQNCVYLHTYRHSQPIWLMIIHVHPADAQMRLNYTESHVESSNRMPLTFPSTNLVHTSSLMLLRQTYILFSWCLIFF